MIRVEQLGPRIFAQIAAIIAPLMLVVIYQAVSDRQRAAQVESAVAARDLSRGIKENFDAFLTYATDAVDLGTLGGSADLALRRSVDAVDALHGRDPAAAGVTNALHGLAEHISVAMPVKDLLALQPRIRAVRDAIAALDEGYERASAQTVRESIESARRQGQVVVGATALTLLVAAWFVYGMIMGVTGPLGEAVDLAGRIADGDLSPSRGPAPRRDLGNLLASLRQMRDTLHRSRQEFEEDHRRLGQSLAERNTELQMRTRDLQRALAELHMLNDVGQAIGTSADADTMMTTIVGCALQLAEADSCTFYAYDPSAALFVPGVSVGLRDENARALRDLRLGLHGNPVGLCVETRTPMQVTDTQLLAQDERKGGIWVDEGIRAGVAVPLFLGGRVVGAFVIRRRRPGPFNRSLVKMLQTLAAQAVLAMEAARGAPGA